jgi:hypothetical protein
VGVDRAAFQISSMRSIIPKPRAETNPSSDKYRTCGNVAGARPRPEIEASGQMFLEMRVIWNHSDSSLGCQIVACFDLKMSHWICLSVLRSECLTSRMFVMLKVGLAGVLGMALFVKGKRRHELLQDCP